MHSMDAGEWLQSFIGCRFAATDTTYFEGRWYLREKGRGSQLTHPHLMHGLTNSFEEYM